MRFSDRKTNPAPVCKQIDNYIFSFTDFLGEGGFSKVYKGTHSISKEPVAIKITQLNTLKSKKLTELLASEIDVLKKLSHPNILKCHEVLTSKQHCYIITELCDGGDLETRLKKERYFSEKAVKNLIKDILYGLIYLEQKNIVHRDLKAANVFLHKGRAKIADFGFAKITKYKFKDVSIGSPIYMSPQGLIYHEYGPKTDVWAFGMLMYELLNGKTPYSHCTNERQLHEQIMKPISRNQFRSGISEQVIDTILQCLKIQEQQRPSFIQLSKMPYFKKLMKNSMQLEIEKTNEKFGQYNSMVHLQQHSHNPKMSPQKLNNNVGYSDKLKAISSQKFFQTINKLVGQQKNDEKCRVNTSRSKSHSRSISKDYGRKKKYYKPTNRAVDLKNQLYQYRENNMGLNLGENSSQKPQHHINNYVNGENILNFKQKIKEEYFSEISVTSHHQNSHRKGNPLQKNSDKGYPYKENPTFQQNPPLNQTNTLKLDNYRFGDHKHHYNAPSKFSPSKQPKSNNDTSHNSHLTTKANEDYTGQQSFRLQSQQTWQSLRRNPQILWSQMKYKECISILHYCRLFYKYIMMVKDIVNTLQRSEKRGMKNGNRDSDEELREGYKKVLEPMVERQIAVYSQWILNILKEIKQKVEDKSIIYEDKIGQKEQKLRDVSHQYYRKYSQALMSNRKNPKFEKSDGAQVEKLVQENYSTFETQINKNKGSNQLYLILGHYLVVMLDSTKKLNKDLQNDRVNEFQNNEIQKFLSRKQESFDMHSYVLIRRKYMKGVQNNLYLTIGQGYKK